MYTLGCGHTVNIILSYTSVFNSFILVRTWSPMAEEQSWNLKTMQTRQRFWLKYSSWYLNTTLIFQNVKDIMKSIANIRNDKAKKQQASKWTKMPSETKTKVIKNWEQKAMTS